MKIKKRIRTFISLFVVGVFIAPTIVLASGEEEGGLVEMSSETIGRFSSGTIGAEGALWRLEDNIITIGAGDLNDDGSYPFEAYLLDVIEIIFTEPVSVGDSMPAIFNLPYLTRIENAELIDTSNLTSMADMFMGADKLIYVDTSSWDTSNVTDMSRMFAGANSLVTLDLSNWDTRNVNDMSEMFYGASNMTSLDVSSWTTDSVENMSGMFNSMNGLKSLDVSNWNTSNVIDMSRMFGFASNITTLDLSDWDTGNVTNMFAMFNGASNLMSLSVSNWDTGNVEDKGFLFADTDSLINLEIYNWNTSNVIFMDGMFMNTRNLTGLDLSGWDTSNVVVMWAMFKGATCLVELDLSNWDTSNVTDMNQMFYGAESLRQLSLSEDFHFEEGSALPNISSNSRFTGFWQNVDMGTIERPLGEYILTSTELMEKYLIYGIADTWVWQKTEALIPTVNRSKLQEKIITANNRMEANYTVLSWTTFAAVLESARMVYRDPDASQLQVDTIRQALMNAMNGLNPIPALIPCDECEEYPCKCPEVCDECEKYSCECPEVCERCEDYPCVCPIAINRGPLREAIAAAGARVQVSYTPVSWATFVAVLESARVVYRDTDATQLQIDIARQALIDAMNGLVTVTTPIPCEHCEKHPCECPAIVNRVALRATIAATEARIRAHYTQASWTPFVNALEAAREVYGNVNATQVQVDAAHQNLINVMNGLVRLPVADSTGSVPKTGDQGNMGLWITIFGIGLIGFMTISTTLVMMNRR